MNIIDHLMSRAEGHWANHQPLPLDLFYDMLGAGIDVDAAERKFTDNMEAH